MSFRALDSVDPDIANLIRNEYRRQSETLELIASENLTSPAILEALGTLLTNKYAEGYPGRRYYGGTGEVIDKIESLAVERAKQLFGAEYVNVQPHAGSQANAAVYMAVCQPGDRVMGMDLSAGGHLTHGSPANFSGKLYEIHSYGVDRETERIDYDSVQKLAEEVRPKMLLAGFSAYSRIVDWQRMRQIADSVGATLFVDMAHVAGLVAGGVYPSPIPHAAITSTTTQKTLRGAWGAIILCRNDWQKAIDSAVFPGTQGGPLMHAIAAKAVCFGEALKPDFKRYAKQVVTNAKALSDRLLERGLRIVTGGTDNHLMLIDLRPQKRTGKQVQDIADTVGITLNRNSIPFDDASKFNPSGVRVGTPLVTTRGMREAEMVVIADCIADLVERIDDRATLDSVHERALELCRSFPIAIAVFAPRNLQTLGLVVVSGLVTGLLIIDDRWSMRPVVKLAVQIGLSLLAVVVFNFQIDYIGLPGGRIVEFALLIAVAVSIFWLVGMQNTVNFLDGADGLAAGVVAIVALILMLAAGQLNQLEVVQLSGALAGCCGGFLLFNFPPARIFMGDSGAHFLGI